MRYRIKLKSLGLALPSSGTAAAGGGAKEEEEDEEADMQFSEDEDGEVDDIAFLGNEAPAPSPASSRRAAQGAAGRLAKTKESVAKRSRAQPEAAKQGKIEKDEAAESDVERQAMLQSFTESAMEAERGSWIIIAAVCCGWGQSDLWEEINALLERV